MTSAKWRPFCLLLNVLLKHMEVTSNWIGCVYTKEFQVIRIIVMWFTEKSIETESIKMRVFHQND